MGAMSDAAHVTSIEAVKEFQAFLGRLCEDVREALVAVEMEGRRTLDWVTHDQAGYWRRAVCDRQDDLAQAKADLFRRQLERLSGQEPDLIEQKEAVWLAERRLREAEEKVENCRRWGPLLQDALEEYQAPARQLAAMVEGDPPRAVALLEQIAANLDSYVFLAPPSGSSQAGGAAEANAKGQPPAPSASADQAKST